MNLTNLNPKVIIGAAILFAILSIIGAYFAVERTNSLVTEKTAHESTQNKLDMAEAFITMKEAQLKRAYAKRTTSTPILIGDKVAYIKTSETLDNQESNIKEYTAQIETLTTQNARLQDTVERLSKVETSKGGGKKWLVAGTYNGLTGFQAGAGYKQDLSLIDIGLFGLVDVNSFSAYSVGAFVGF